MTAFRSPGLRVAVVLATLAFAGLATGATVAPAPPHDPPGADPGTSAWVWPVAPAHVVARFVAPAHEYGPGHRGIDLRASSGSEIVSPAAGVVAFAGSVAGRGIVTIDHGAGLVTTLEPVRALVAIGATVWAGEVVAVADVGGHTALGALHFGVREYGRYIDPRVLLGGVPRAILLPCC
jgi:murein DD-endopeptidase MepM/ murein hydrolase activator NlpD